MLRIKVTFGEVVESVQLTGDFFLHPEEMVTKLEESLRGLHVASSRDLFLDRLRHSIVENRVELIGVSADDIVDTLLETLNPPAPNV